MICHYFGLPGSGKTSILVATAISIQYKINHNMKCRYKRVYCNEPIAYPGIIHIKDMSVFGVYDMSESAIFIDESTLIFNARKYKDFSDNYLKAILLHRHYKQDIFLFSQRANSIDVTIRSIVDRVYFVHKGALLPDLSYAVRLPFKVGPPPKDQGPGDILEGYTSPGFINRLFAFRLWRPCIYGRYDTYSCSQLPKMPKSLYAVMEGLPKKIKNKKSFFKNNHSA